MNPTARLPVFQNGSHVLFDTVEIILYIERIAMVSFIGNNIKESTEEIIQWMHKIQAWNLKYFTLSHVPEKRRIQVSKFIRRVVIARMAESPDLASAYHQKLKEAYETEEKLRNQEVVKQSEEHLINLLDEVDEKLGQTAHLGGEDFSMADVMFIPVLAKLAMLDLEDDYINNRSNIAEYWAMAKQRPSYKKVIGRYFSGWRKYKTLIWTWSIVNIKSLLKNY
ncbi:hypothetical protein SAY87_026641 [Trapa incisa]|nr:hypothetical protein SAY87_026641 [Trapa incisa]